MRVPKVELVGTIHIGSVIRKLLQIFSIVRIEQKLPNKLFAPDERRGFPLKPSLAPCRLSIWVKQSSAGVQRSVVQISGGSSAFFLNSEHFQRRPSENTGRKSTGGLGGFPQ
jgi:hypothetical protein